MTTLPGLDTPTPTPTKHRRPPIPDQLTWLAGKGPGHPTPRWCPKCQTWTLQGWTREPCAIPATITPTPLTPAAEITALLTHTMTFTVWRGRHHATLEPRTPRRIKTHPPGAPALPWHLYDVMPAHDCRDWTAHAAPTRLAPPPAQKGIQTDACPF